MQEVRSGKPRSIGCWTPGWLAGLWLACGIALAHTAGMTGYAKLSISGQTVRFAITLPTDVLASGGAGRDLNDIADAVRRHIRITTDGTDCASVPAEVRPPAPERASFDVVVHYACVAPVRNLEIRDDLDAVLGADYHTIADIEWPGGARRVVFEQNQRSASLSLADDEAREKTVPAGTLASYFALGVEHILLGLDHVLFVIALILPGGRLLSLAAMITAFTVAHSITLALSVLDIMAVPAWIVEPVIALSIAYVAFENLAMRSAVSRRWAVSFIFGLVHGFGFAGALAEVGLPASALVAALIGFNLGVEAGQLLIVVVLLALLVWLQNSTWKPRVAKASSIAILAVGLVLLTERVLTVSI